MKKIFSTILLATLMGLQGCQDLLEETNRSVATSSYLSTAAGFEDAVRGAYSYLRVYYGTEEGMSMTVYGTDEYTHGAGTGNEYLNRYTSAFNSSATFINTIWVGLYKGVNAANTVINRAEEVTGVDDATKKIRVAEARFLRAHYYFLLVQHFGPIYLTDKETTEVSTEARRASLKDIYDFIVADLDFAIANLPVSQSNWGRATKYAAQHMSAKVHLTRATMDTSITPKDEYQKASDAAVAVINSNAFTLLPDYVRVFDQGAGEINSEVIWSVQYINDQLTNGTGNSSHLYFLMSYDKLPGMVRDIANGRPWARYKPNLYTFSIYNRAADSRMEKNFKSVFYSNRAGTYSINGRSVKMNAGDTAVYLPMEEWSQEQINSKNYTVIVPSKYNADNFPTLIKFLDPNRPDVSATAGSRDFLVYRYSETYLIAAEAQFYLGNSAEAAKWLNVVRARAARPGYEEAMKISASQVNLDFILDERSRELLGEQHRWFDLVRTKKLVERVKKYNPDGAPNIQDFHNLRPIPQSQIDRVKNPDGVSFGQNPGY